MTVIPTGRLITVFGGSGFLGRHLVRALANDGWRIRVAVRNPNTAHVLKPMGRVGQIQLLKTNVRNRNEIEAALKGADAAVNLVGVLVSRGRQSFAALHGEVPGLIAEAARAHGVAQLVHISALGADAHAPALYYRSKAAGEDRLRQAFPAAAIVRPGPLFGPEDQFFNRFAALARMSPVVPLFGGGRARLQPVFAGDVARAIVQILREPEAAGQIFECAGPEVMTLRQIVERVLTETRRKRLMLPVPFSVARIQGALLGLLPNPPLTLDQVRMMETNSVASGAHPGLTELGILPTAAEAIVPAYLWRFRKTGQFAPLAQ